MAVDPFSLQRHVGQQGGASKLLHDGPAIKLARSMPGSGFNSDAGETDYHFRLAYAADDALFFDDERYRMSRGDQPGGSILANTGSGRSGVRNCWILVRATIPQKPSSGLC